jgi:hypothetical protein
MKTITLALCVAVFACSTAPVSESQHSAIVDMPQVATLSHASPDTWHTLPPVPPKDVHATTALMFAQLEATCPSRNSLSVVEFF